MMVRPLRHPNTGIVIVQVEKGPFPSRWKILMNTGKIEIYYTHQLEVISETR
jgi:hypothetical protein